MGKLTNRHHFVSLLALVLMAAFATNAVAQEASTPKDESDPLPEVKTAGYKKGFYIQSQDEKFKAVIGGRVQTRFTYEGLESEPDEYSFSIPRARLKLSGHAFTKRLKYAFQTDFGKGGATLKDFYVDGAIVPKYFHVRVGQFKRPFARQAINSSSKLELVERSVGDKIFKDGRDLGVMLHNNYSKAKGLEWAVGVFNGTGEKPWFSPKYNDDGTVSSSSKFTNVPDQFLPTMVLRLGYNHGGIKGYSEADLEGGGFRFAVAGAAYVAFKDDDDISNFKAGGDYVIKAHGFSHTGACYVWTAGDGFDNHSYNALFANFQAGYVFAKRIQPVVRYSFLDYNGDNNMDHEALAGFNVFIFGHNVKWQTDGGMVLDGVDDQNNWLVRTQLQFAF